MISLFPNSFNEKMCDQLLAHLHRWVDVLASNAKQTRRGEVRGLKRTHTHSTCSESSISCLMFYLSLSPHCPNVCTYLSSLPSPPSPLLPPLSSLPSPPSPLLPSSALPSQLQEVPICLSIMQMLHMLPASSFKLADPLVQLCFKAETAIGVDVCNGALSIHLELNEGLIVLHTGL